MARRDEADGRGALGTVDMLPPLADHAVIEAVARLRDRRMTQKAIHAAFNVRLHALGLEPIPRTTFYRWAKLGLARGFAPRHPAPPAGVVPATASSPACCPHCGAPLLIVARPA
ncbi:hypothetical protein PQJ75_14055 [Rhodoplanes sp. TEM]|uniref:Helix-turn-helix domain-containing protein n=1 Tax=Rhodoplanes tepidamans TaxID=200616 RepID=A0ABT5JFB5_RHOTP|nr:MULTISPECIES: hypothetical protein [Rhodoplanes]MDC7788016.1 hypothetical protein [Rhodoplanes tepidamans]MDC7984856.1 hypothetical protein [Rhodoplanes sp. TEM]MDQ0358445.1 hypothetical protein [Rhodoplanes tepidamans]